MTFAPADLLNVQRYCRDETGQSWASLGIIHSTPQGGGYHEGEDLLIQAGTAPGPQYPGSDYSYTDSRRDLLPNGRLAGGDAASAFDLGGTFKRFLEFNAWMRARMLAGDPRTRDIREMIHTLDGRTVRRIDRTGTQPDSGDSSHTSHTHFSFFRDSEGRRDDDDNFLGLMKEFFDGRKPTPTPALAPGTQPTAVEDDMPTLINKEIPDEFAFDEKGECVNAKAIRRLNFPGLNSSDNLLPWGEAFLTLFTDAHGEPGPQTVDTVRLRIAVFHPGGPTVVVRDVQYGESVTWLNKDNRLPTGTTAVQVGRMRRTPDEPIGMVTPSLCLEIGRRT